MYFRITPLGEYCLGIASSYESAPIEVRPVLRVLPNLEIAAIGPDLERGDRLALALMPRRWPSMSGGWTPTSCSPQSRKEDRWPRSANFWRHGVGPRFRIRWRNCSMMPLSGA